MSTPTKKKRERKPLQIETLAGDWIQIFKNNKRVQFTNKLDIGELKLLLTALNIPYEVKELVA